MVRAIIALGTAIGASVIAEGIETTAECETLEQMGIEFGQGYLLARPDAGPQ
jgi:EAL domain-containing protein (putative c-di-GMP-specific phosphodiesterase class I)